MAPVTFAPRWKEELVGTLDGKTFVVELTMGVLHVFFPTEEKWRAQVPAWAQDQWPLVKDSLTTWCRQQQIPLTIEPSAWVQFDP
jgi:hypothetical protein